MILNGIIIFVSFVLAFKVPKETANTIVHRLYFVIYHTCFCLMHYYEEGEEYVLAGFIGLCVVVAVLIHALLELAYRVVKCLYLCYRDCVTVNSVTNDN